MEAGKGSTIIPSASSPPGASLDLYLETQLPYENERRFEFVVTLLPIPEVSGRKKSFVEFGEVVAVADSLDQPFEKGEWLTSRGQELLDSLARHRPSSNVITLETKESQGTGDLTVIELSPVLKRNLKSGSYLLAVTVSDPEEQRYFFASHRVIRIAPTVGRLRKPDDKIIRKWGVLSPNESG